MHVSIPISQVILLAFLPLCTYVCSLSLWPYFCFANKSISRFFLDSTLKKKKKVKLLSHVQLFATPWTIAHQAPLSMGFSRQEYWSGLPFPYPGDLPNPGIEPRSPALQADALTSEPPGKHDVIWYLLFSFWNTPLCMTYNRSIHISANGTILFLKNGSI